MYPGAPEVPGAAQRWDDRQVAANCEDAAASLIAFLNRFGTRSVAIGAATRSRQEPERPLAMSIAAERPGLG